MAKSNSEMIRKQIWSRGIRDFRVIRAMLKTDRRDFVPNDQRGAAYEDKPVPICPGATVSQPYIVGLMTELLDVKQADRVLEVGTGSGYQAAVLARLAREVWGVELQQDLVDYAGSRLARAGLWNVQVVRGNGWKGLEHKAPFDRIIVTAAPGTVPRALIHQLANGGRMIIPVGTGNNQALEVIDKDLKGNVLTKVHSSVQFVPLVSPQTSE